MTQHLDHAGHLLSRAPGYAGRRRLRTGGSAAVDAAVWGQLGGGYGLVLRTAMIAESGSRTLIPDSPSDRSTEDLDIFLKAEVISDPQKTWAIREALDRCGYGPVVNLVTRPCGSEG